MNIFKILRKPYLSILMASLILFVSCEQYELHSAEKVIDYSLFEEFKKTKIDLSFLAKENVSNYELSLAIQQEVNEIFDASLYLPEEWHKSIGLPAEAFLQKGKQYGWINTKDEEFILEFSNEIETKGSSIAISNYETKLLNMNLSQEEFDKKTFFLNAMKSFEYSGVFDSNLKSLSCVLAIIAFLIAFSNLISCGTIIGCGIAVLAYLIAVNNVVEACGTRAEQLEDV